MKPIDLERLRQWVGKERSVEDALTPFPAQALAAALDQRLAPAMGSALPPGWQWLYFLETPQASATGGDGHPKLGGFMPPVPLPRRMFASGEMEILRPLQLGIAAQRRSLIQSVEAKSGKSGSLVFVNVEHQISQADALCIREQQSFVYRDMPTAPTPSPRGEPAPTNADWSRVVHPDPVLLFRYSALTYNGHRIHYDRRYATEQEFYPGLVVHGPLLATLLLDLLHEQLPGARVSHFQFRALLPTFDTAPFSINGRRDGNRVSLWVASHEGALSVSATATLA